VKVANGLDSRSTVRKQVMAVGRQKIDMKMKLENKELEQVEEFSYLGSVMTEDGKCRKYIKRKIGLASTMVNKFSKLWRINTVSNKMKVKLYETFVVPVLLYGLEC